ncbi:CoA pyrophosphatase [Agromyces sp. SYSU K20354]|uniref:NUDIX hydrolase n=1 Tax=Agromyces cavernae TaxID=2898659 RepID=UPI001E5BBF13|nr:CoA pyrophosphatase [Agromyces cavernae]MCD2441874.1 CoA pyrophosphatase [Agromyces cavernae]
MPTASSDARADLVALCERGIDWRLGPQPMLGNDAPVRDAAVLVLFGVLDSVPAGASNAVARDLDVLLQRRAATLSSHAGQIAFPGGRLEPTDSDAAAGALREAVEETGLDPSGVDVLGALTPFPVPVSNHLVTPVPAWWSRPSEVAAVDHAETVDTFRVPVADLVDPANRAMTEHRFAGEVYHSPAFAVDGRVVWGFTAMVLSRMFEDLGWAVEWDDRRVVEP